MRMDACASVARLCISSGNGMVGFTVCGFDLGSIPVAQCFLNPQMLLIPKLRCSLML